MSNDRATDLASLVKAIVPDGDGITPNEPELPASAFAQRLRTVLAEAISTMRANGMLEVEDDQMESLVAEVAEAGLDTKSAKQLVSRIIRTLLESDHVEEIYGTDDEIRDALRQLLGE